MQAPYDPFQRGPFAVTEQTVDAHDAARERLFTCEVWAPAGPGPHPLVLFSHHGGGHRRRSSFLCSHLASHGYLVAALDHSEEVDERVPDLRFLLATMLGRADPRPDPERVAAVGHSFGGWTVLAAAGVEPRIRVVAALAPAGSPRPVPGVIPVTLDLAWQRDVPTLFIAAEHDVPIPPDRVRDPYEQARSPKRMVVLSRADHMHFADDVEREHEAFRALTMPEPAAWMPGAMLPIDTLYPGEVTHLAVRGLVLSHLDAALLGRDEAQRFLDGDVEAVLAKHGVEVTATPPR